MAISTTCNQYNKQHVKELEQKGAAKKYLNPIDLYDKPITTAFSKDTSPIPDEQAYFKAFHFVKFRLYKAQNEGSKRIKFWYQMFMLLRNRLVSGNMGLVYECLRKSTCAAVYRDKTEFISAGSMTLIRSVECFDPWRGHRFSTYAYRALLHQYNHVASLLSRSPILDVSDIDVPDKSLENDGKIDFLVDRIKVAVNYSGLTDQEQEVVHMRFSEGMKLVEIGNCYEVTKERARQIQNIALAKIRSALKQDKTLVQEPLP